MGLRSLFARFWQSLRRLRKSIVQECPPELYACEACDKLECDDEEWLHCKKRLRTAAVIHELQGSKCKFEQD